jgi:Fe-S-cluster containining protein
MTWEEDVQDFGLELGPNSTFQFECQPELSCFGVCCNTEVTLTSYDIARARGHMNSDTTAFLAKYCEVYLDALTGFPYVVLKRKDDGKCVFLKSHGCNIYENRPSCCRNYPLARVVDENETNGERISRYHLQNRATYCQGMGQGQEWTVDAYCEANGLGPYEKANDLFLDVAFTFRKLPCEVKYDREVQTMIFQALFDFDRFFKEYGAFSRAAIPSDDGELIAVIRRVTLNLMGKFAKPNSTGLMKRDYGLI